MTLDELQALDGAELNAAIGRVIGDTLRLADYCNDWSIAGPLIQELGLMLSPPESRVHRNGGNTPGWGASGVWSCTSWKLRKADGARAFAYDETRPLVAAMRLIVACSGDGK